MQPTQNGWWNSHLTIMHSSFFYICLLSGRSQYSNMNSDFYFVSFFCYCYQWPLLLFLHRHEPSMYTRTQYFPNQFPGMIKPSSGRVSPPSAHHGMFDRSSQEIWRSETFIQVNYAYIGLPDVHLLFQTRSAWCIFSVVVVTINKLINKLSFQTLWEKLFSLKPFETLSTKWADLKVHR